MRRYKSEYNSGYTNFSCIILGRKAVREVSESNKEKLKTVKRVLAMILAVALVLLYLSTVFFAITDNPKTMSFFKASVALTILVPVLLYAYQLVFRVMKSLGDNNKTNQ